jgi:hypothetical protein
MRNPPFHLVGLCSNLKSNEDPGSHRILNLGHLVGMPYQLADFIPTCARSDPGAIYHVSRGLSLGPEIALHLHLDTFDDNISLGGFAVDVVTEGRG